ncbi:MAG: tripartite tricarboxylate transporter TctB family protein [Pseudomonadota bacterium]
MNGRTAKRQALMAAGVIALAVLVGYQTLAIPVTPLYARIGPKVFPGMVAAGLLALGLLLLWQARSGSWGEIEEDGPPDWRALGWVGLGLAVNLALIKPLGFILASTLMFCCVARAFGSRRPVRDGVVALAVSTAAFVGFDRVLGISIGAGILAGLL